jgi:hypothetical protein
MRRYEDDLRGGYAVDAAQPLDAVIEAAWRHVMEALVIETTFAQHVEARALVEVGHEEGGG